MRCTLGASPQLLAGSKIIDVDQGLKEDRALFSGAQRCGLALTHKERNSWGCWKGHCVEYAWVSLRHAHRLAREDGLRAEWATPTVPET